MTVPSDLPATPDPLLRALREASLALREMEPWKWMREEDLFGMVDPATGTLHIAAVLGHEEGPPGLVLYRGERGYRFLFRKQDDPGSPIDPDIAMEEDSLIVEFVPQSDLKQHDLDLLEASGGVPPPAKSKRKSAGTPRYRSHLPAHLPWLPDKPEVELLTTALVLAQAFTALVDESPDFYGKRPYEEIPVYTRVGANPDSPWKLDWVRLDFSQRDGPAQFVPAQELLDDARTRMQDPLKAWELEAYHPPTVIPKPRRPFFPRASVIADAENGRFLDIELSHPEEPVGEHAGRSLLDTIRESGYRPAALYVNTPALAEALWAVCEQLSIRLRYRARLRQTEAIREYLAKRFKENPGEI